MAGVVVEVMAGEEVRTSILWLVRSPSLVIVSVKFLILLRKTDFFPHQGGGRGGRGGRGSPMGRGGGRSPSMGRGGGRSFGGGRGRGRF